MVDTELYQQELDALRETIAKAADALNLPLMQEELAEMKEEMNAPEFWNNLERSMAVTRNVRHFEDMGVPLLDPWAAP